jgi:hypothetical protein
MSIITGHVHKVEGRDTNLGGIVQYQWTNPEAADVDHVVVAEAPATALGATKELTKAADPDYVRPLTYEVSVDASGDLSMTFDTYGTDFWGNSRHESVTAVTLAGGAVDGNIAWRTITKIVATTGGAAADAADRVRVGYDATRFGLPVPVKSYADILIARLNHGAALTYVTTGLGAGEFMVHQGLGYWNIEFGDAADGTNDYLVEVMSRHGVRYETP